MVKNKKVRSIVLITFIFVVIIGILFAQKTSFVFADTAYGTNNLLDSYTNDDSLINNIGSEKDIFDFSEEVKNKKEDEEVEDLTKVIPIEYVRFVEDDYKFQYNGNEYGFFVCHRENVGKKLIDVVLFDFKYDYDDIYCSVKIQLLLQVTVQYHNDNGNESWTMHNENAKKDYYIVNPRFISVLQNENALNYGDNGYLKSNDNGAIIQQAKLNYDGIITVNDGITQEEQFLMVKSVFSGVTNYLMGLVPGLGTVYGVVTDINDFIDTLVDSLDYKTIELSQGSDGEILNKSRGVQEQESENIPFSRAMMTTSSNEILLTDEESSYMKCTTVIDDSVSRCRLIQCVQFDILQTDKDEPAINRTFMNEYDEDGNKIPFAAYQETILFEDQSPKFEVAQNNIEGSDIFVYLLPNGKQVIEFIPEYTAYYQFALENSEGTTIFVTDSNSNIVAENEGYELKYGEKYYITVYAQDKKVITYLSIKLMDKEAPEIIDGDDKLLVKFDIFESDIYSIKTNNLNCLVSSILIKTTGGLKTYSVFDDYSPYSSVSVPLSSGEYYLLLENTSSVDEILNLNIEGCAYGETNKENIVETDGKNYAFMKFDIEPNNYIGTILDANNYKVLDYNMVSITIMRYNSGNFEFRNNGDIIYIAVFADKGNATILLNASEYSCTWEIDGELVDNNNVDLERGNSYEIAFYINGIEQGTDFIYYIDDEFAEGINFNGSTLTIYDFCETNKSFIIKYSFNEVAESKSQLKITSVYTIDFDGIKSVTNDETLSFDWVQTEKLASIYYTLTGDSSSDEYVIDVSGYLVGNTYTENITNYALDFGITNITISVYKIGVNTSQGIQIYYLDNPSSATVHAVYGGGSGASNDPYIITCARHFKNLSLSNSKSNKIMVEH